MLEMLYGFLKISFVFIVFTYSSCIPAASVRESTEIEPQVSSSVKIFRNEIQTPGKVKFKGVSFNYNPQFFSEIKPEKLAETPLQNKTDKPGGEYPNHVSFNLKNANQKQIGVLKILPIEDYKKMYAVWDNYEEIIGREFADLQRVIKDTSFRRNGEIPYVLFYDAHQTFQAKVRSSSFQNGKGIFFLTQINQEYYLVNNEGLSYYFQGITNDGRVYVWAEFSPTVEFLPRDFEADEFEGYKLELRNKDDVKRFEEYVTKISQRLDKLPPEEFQPNLKYFEEIISSLKIEN